MNAPSKEAQVLTVLTQRQPEAKIAVNITRPTNLRMVDGTPLYYWGLRSDIGIHRQFVVGFGTKPHPRFENSDPAAWRVTGGWFASLFRVEDVGSEVQLLKYVEGDDGDTLVMALTGDSMNI